MDEFVGGARLGGTIETGSQERRVIRPWQDSECIPNGASAAHTTAGQKCGQNFSEGSSELRAQCGAIPGAERHRSRTCLASGYDAVLVLKTNWGTGPSRSERDSN